MTNEDIDIDELAEKVSERIDIDDLDTGKVSDDRWLLSRRQLAAIAGSAISAGTLASLGIGSADAQAASGQIGNSSNPVDIESVDINNSGTISTTDIDVSGSAGSLNTDDISNSGQISSVEYLSSTDPLTLRPASADVGLTQSRVSLSDDSAATADASNSGILFITSREGQRGSGLFFTRFSGVTTIQTNNSTNQGSTTLSGTTGPDGSLNVSRNGNTLNIENRTGRNEEYIIFQLGP
jgi:hypothetical protein